MENEKLIYAGYGNLCVWYSEPNFRVASQLEDLSHFKPYVLLDEHKRIMHEKDLEIQFLTDELSRVRIENEEAHEEIAWRSL